jgi:hypothetical protein
MSSLWFTAFGLLALLAIGNALLSVALMRQIGVLHTRIKPVGPGQHEGPAPGSELPLVSFDAVGEEQPRTWPLSHPISVLAYVNPGCGVCESLRQAVNGLLSAGSLGDELEVMFVTDAPQQSAAHYLREERFSAPLFHSPAIAKLWDLPGSPYVIAVSAASSSSVRVLTAGVVNSLEQLEMLIDQALAARTQETNEPAMSAPPNGDAGLVLSHVMPGAVRAEGALPDD